MFITPFNQINFTQLKGQSEQIFRCSFAMAYDSKKSSFEKIYNISKI